MRVFYVYILLCSDKTYYVGITNDVKRRFQEHQNGTSETSYTKRRLPVQLVYQETFVDPVEAIRREKQIKKWSRLKKEALMERRWVDLRYLSKGKKRV